MLERIWNGWRATYVRSLDSRVEEGSGSLFTQILCSGLSDEETYIVRRGERCFAILNSYPYGTGHLLVLPYREVADIEALDIDESAELWGMMSEAVRAIKAAYDPDGINVGINLGRPAGGSVSEHLHVHVVPRWTGDANFMTVVANTRTLPEPLSDTAAKIRSSWPARA